MKRNSGFKALYSALKKNKIKVTSRLYEGVDRSISLVKKKKKIRTFETIEDLCLQIFWISMFHHYEKTCLLSHLIQNGMGAALLNCFKFDNVLEVYLGRYYIIPTSNPAQDCLSLTSLVLCNVCTEALGEKPYANPGTGGTVSSLQLLKSRGQENKNPMVP